MSVFLVPQTLEQLYAVGTASISRTVFGSKRSVCCQAAKPKFSTTSWRVFDYLYVCTRIFSIYFTYFTNSIFFFFKSYLHTYTLTHVSHHVSPTLIINVFPLRQHGIKTEYVHLKCSFLVYSKHKHIKQPLAYLTQSAICTFENIKNHKPVLY